MIRTSELAILFVALLTPVCAAAAETTAPEVDIVHLPRGALVPSVVLDAKGVLHVVYARDMNAYYVRSADDGKTFTEPVKVNSAGSVEFKMGEADQNSR